MADLTVTINESLTLNGALRGGGNTITTANIVDVYERIVTCAHANTTTVCTFATTPHTSAGAIDVENVAYARITNLSTTDAIYFAVVGTAKSYTVKIRPEGSHMLFNGEDVMTGEEDTSPAFTGLEDLASFQVQPTNVTDCQVEVFIALT